MKKQIYYHYLSTEYGLDDLDKERLKVSKLDSLNDPFEFKHYRRYGFKERQPYNKLFRKIKNEWGILCFSKTWESQLPWAYYANKHKGMALGFKIPEDKLIKVNYSFDEIREKFELTDDESENEKKLLNLASIKFHEWGYEKESRLLVEFSDCVPDKGLYFLPFSNVLKICEIRLGCRFNHNKNKDEILRLANKLGIKVIAMREGWEDYKIHKDGTKSGWYQKNQ